MDERKVRIVNFKAEKNPELEQLRESGLSQKVNPNDIASQLKDEVKNIHAAYLFSSNGRSVLKKLCEVVSATPADMQYSSWKDLAAALKLTFHQIGCIEQYRREPTEIAIKTFSQNWDSTLYQIVGALQSINRFDAIEQVKSGLQELVKQARQEQIRRTENTNDDLNIFGSEKGTSDGILRPLFNLSLLSSELPITLSNADKKAEFAPLFNEGKLQQNCNSISCKKQKKFNKAVMLTFAADGVEIARRIAKQFRQQRGKNLPIGVLMLDEHYEKVVENPEKFITHIFPQMDYIIPILSEGYLFSLRTGSQNQGNSLTSIDSQYVQFIHDLMTKYYVNNNCKNDKFRCIIPDEQFFTVRNHKHNKLDPILQAYVKESEAERLAYRILRIKWNPLLTEKQTNMF